MSNRRHPLVRRRADQIGACESSDPDRWHNLGAEDPAAIRQMYGTCARCPIIDMCRSQLEMHLARIEEDDLEPLRETLWAGQFFGKRGWKVRPGYYLKSRSQKVVGLDSAA